jgi:hypothetical protein
MSGSLLDPGVPCPSLRCRALVARGVVLSTLLLGAGCGEDVLVGSLQLRSLSDAGADLAEAVEADAGVNPQGRSAEDAREHAACKILGHGDRHCVDESR